MSLIRRVSPDRPVAAKVLNEWEPIRLFRDLMNWEPFRELTHPVGRIEPIFVPDFEVKETKEAHEFRADLPGVKEADLEVRVAGLQLVIVGKRETEVVNDADTFYICERMYGTFTRTFTLPPGADLEHIVAALKDGVLTLHIPKKPEVQAKKIPVVVKTPEMHT